MYLFGKTTSKSRLIPTVHGTRPHGWEYYNPSNVLQSSTGPFDVIVDSGTSKITYTTRNWAVPGYSSASNLCVHQKTRDWYSGDVNVSQRINDLNAGKAGWYYTYWNGHNFAATYHGLAKTAAVNAMGQTIGIAHLNNGAQAWMNDAAQRTKPDLTKVSIPNFIADIEDVKTLFRAWQRSVSVVKNVAGAYLNYKFGWKPTIGDLSDALRAVATMQNSLKFFKAAVGSLIKESVLLEKTSVSKTGTLNPEAYCYCDWKATLKQSVKAYIVWSPQPLAVMGDLDEKIRGIVDSLGFELNPRIIWDALPFTFVVDWFFNVGRVLERYKYDALELPITYVDSFLQYKQELTIESATRLDVGSPVSSPTKWPGWVYKDDLFYRLPLKPDFGTLTGIGFRVPTFNQATLLVALGAVLAPTKGEFKPVKGVLDYSVLNGS